MPTETGEPVPFLSDVGLLTTYRCQVTCPHCIVQAGPRRKEQAQLDEARAWIRDLAAYRDGWVRVLALTGGEPFYNIRHLAALAEYAQACGLIVTVVSNAFWAASLDKAVRILEAIPALTYVGLSTDVYHQVSIPLSYVRNAAAAAERCGRSYMVSVCTQTKSDPAYLAIMDQLHEFADDSHVRTAITLPVGRALAELGTADYETADEPPPAACTSSSPIIFPDGRIVACIGPVIDLMTPHPLLLGNLREESMSSILDRAQLNPVLHIIRAWGPRKLVSLARDAGLGRYLPARYLASTICQTCYQLMSTPPIVEFLGDLMKDPDWQRTAAYARAYYLEEPEGMQSLGLLPEAVESMQPN